jgi:hypothetical protein
MGERTRAESPRPSARHASVVVTNSVTTYAGAEPPEDMTVSADPAIEQFCGSRVRLETLGVLAAAVTPMTGYRVAQIAGLPREKVYPELRKAVALGTVQKDETGYVLVDGDLRTLLRKRVRVTFESAWDRPLSAGAVEAELRQIRTRTRKIRLYDSANRIPAAAIRELERDPEKNGRLRRLGLRPSKRKKP